MAIHWHGKVLLPCVSLLFLSSFPSFAANYRQIDVPGSTATIIYGINSAGQMVGQYLTATGGSGFVFSNRTFTDINYPGTTGDTATGINDQGDIVGYYYTDAFHSFLYRNGQFTSIAYPGAISTQVNGINNLGDVVGAYTDQTGGWHGFLLDQEVFTSFDVPGADFTSAFGINDRGIVSGYFHTYCDYNCDMVENFFFYGGQITAGTPTTETYGINNLNQAVGNCNVVRGGPVTACLLAQHHSWDWNYPGMYSTQPYAINDQDVIVGEIVDFSLHAHGFVLQPRARIVLK